MEIEIVTELSCSKLDCILYTESSYEFEVIEEGEWEQDHKTQFRTSVLKCINSENSSDIGKLFSIDDSRSGSYHTDWSYDTEYDKSIILHEVEETTISKVVYVRVK